MGNIREERSNGKGGTRKPQFNNRAYSSMVKAEEKERASPAVRNRGGRKRVDEESHCPVPSSDVGIAGKFPVAPISYADTQHQ